MPDYSKGKIYKVVNDILNMRYVGSTVQPLSARMSAHRANHKSGGFARYQKWGMIEDCKIYLIENYPCKDKHELESRERHFIERFGAGSGCVNIQIPTRTRAQYNQENRERILQGKTVPHEQCWENKSIPHVNSARKSRLRMRVGCDKAPPLAALQISKARVLPSLTPTAATLRFEVPLRVRYTCDIIYTCRKNTIRILLCLNYIIVLLHYCGSNPLLLKPHRTVNAARHLMLHVSSGGTTKVQKERQPKNKMQYAIK